MPGVDPSSWVSWRVHFNLPSDSCDEVEGKGAEVGEGGG